MDQVGKFQVETLTWQKKKVTRVHDKNKIYKSWNHSFCSLILAPITYQMVGCYEAHVKRQIDAWTIRYRYSSLAREWLIQVKNLGQRHKGKKKYTSQ